MSQRPLRIGRIAYLNVVPFFHSLDEAGFHGEIRAGVPADLNRLLAAGVIDACPSSSFEYGRHAPDYLLIPGHSISSIGPVHSVLLFSSGPLDRLDGRTIALTGESATSVNLLQILLREVAGCRDVVCRVPDLPIEESLRRGEPTLLIGDRALAAAKACADAGQIHDLGELWYRHTGLPFVFALWIVRRDAARRDLAALQAFARQLDLARQRAFADLDAVAAALSAREVLEKNEMIAYWRELSYDLTPAHHEGLRRYFSLCHKHGLLASVPELSFLPVA
ncbi:MAG: menaquinone biosynthesis protein [Desulfuromonadales bacterium]|nr:menaquinone biosynthesis protein [Desulfuromonadales bacterium]